MTNCLQVVTSRLLDTLVGCDGGVPGCSSEVLSLLDWDVFSLTIHVTFGKSEIDNVYVVFGCVRASDQEVIWLDVTMNNPLGVHLLDTADQLDSDHKNSFQVELLSARLEQVLEGWSQQVHHHDMELLVWHRVVSTDIVETWHAS